MTWRIATCTVQAAGPGNQNSPPPPPPNKKKKKKNNNQKIKKRKEPLSKANVGGMLFN